MKKIHLYALYSMLAGAGEGCPRVVDATGWSPRPRGPPGGGAEAAGDRLGGRASAGRGLLGQDLRQLLRQQGQAVGLVRGTSDRACRAARPIRRSSLSR